jgi:hypothetical protein
MVIRAIASAGLVLMILLLSAESAMACSCVAVKPKTKLADSKGAVTARLLEVDGADFVYRAGYVVKGKARGLRRGRRLVVRNVADGTSCGLSNRVGDVIGLFLSRKQGRWTAFSCDEISAGQMRRLGRATAARSTAPVSCA